MCVPSQPCTTPRSAPARASCCSRGRSGGCRWWAPRGSPSGVQSLCAQCICMLEWMRLGLDRKPPVQTRHPTHPASADPNRRTVNRGRHHRRRRRHPSWPPVAPHCLRPGLPPEGSGWCLWWMDGSGGPVESGSGRGDGTMMHACQRRASGYRGSTSRKGSQHEHAPSRAAPPPPPGGGHDAAAAVVPAAAAPSSVLCVRVWMWVFRIDSVE